MAVLLILLKILKVIGIILLCILGLILLILLTVLITPVHYRLEGLSEDEMRFSVRVTYLARFLLFDLSYGRPGGLGMRGTALWGRIKLFPREEEPDYTRDFSEEAGEELEKAAGDDEPADTGASDGAGDELEGDVGDEVDITSSTADTRTGAAPEAAEPCSVFAEEDSPEQADEKKESVFDKIKSVREKWLTEGNKRAVRYVMGQLAFVLRKYAPRSAKGQLTYSTGDPALTGEVFGVMWLMPFMYSGHFAVTPDFEAESFYAKGRMVIKGFIQPGVLVVVLVRLLANKDTRHLIMQVIKK